MKQDFASLAAFLDHGFDTVIDVRAPCEFAEDHVPGAINLPVLSDEERARVGRMYKQVSPFDARKLGAALVSRNAAAHLQGPLADRPGDWRPLVYCWRGGQRSGSFASILSQIGWRVGVVEDGYMRWRRLVSGALYDQAYGGELVLLDGLTGTGKTDLLPHIAAHGVQVLDLEGLAHHRGSLLGARPEGQPRQKAFESQLACALARIDPARPVVVEAESNKIGDLHIPPALWDVMKHAPRIHIDAPPEARAAYLMRAYGDMITDPAQLRARLEGLRQLRGAAAFDTWSELIEDRDYTGLAMALMRDHYDPAYRKSRAAHPHRDLTHLTAPALEPDDLIALARDIAAVVTRK